MYSHPRPPTIYYIFSCQLDGSMQLYADDVTIVYGDLCYESMKNKMFQDLTIINNWMETNNLSVN